MKLREFGEPILRLKAARVEQEAITSPEVQQLVGAMRKHLLESDAGVALAAPQVGVSKRIVVAAVRPTSYRPDAKPIDLVMINPRIVQRSDDVDSPWEACLSMPRAKLRFAQTPRSTWVKVSYHDETGKRHTRTFRDLMAQIAQHEIDHLNGVLFIDRVTDNAIYLTKRQYITMLESEKGL